MRKLNSVGLPSLIELLPPLTRLNQERKPNVELETFLQVLQSQADAIAANIDALYENWFIETAAPWAVPYIADLVDVAPELSNAIKVPSQRSYVANTLVYRALRGTPAALAGALQDATGWPVDLVEGIDRQLTTSIDEFPHTLQPRIAGASDLLERRLNTRAEPVRSGFAVGGTQPDNQTPVIQSYFWPVELQRLKQVEISLEKDGSFSLHPCGFDLALRHPLPAQPASDRLPKRQPLPLRLTRLDLDSLLQSEQLQLPLRLVLDGKDIKPEQIRSADLSAPLTPAFHVEMQAAARKAGEPTLLVDPEMGRGQLIDPDNTDQGLPPHQLLADFWFASSGRFAGGSYDRTPRLIKPTPDTRTILVGADADRLAAAGEFDDSFETLNAAVRDWGSREQSSTIIYLANNGLHSLPRLPTRLAARAGELAIQALNGFRPTITGLARLVSRVRTRLSVVGCTIPEGLTVDHGLDLSLIDCTLWASTGPALQLKPGEGKGMPPKSKGPSVRILNTVIGPIKATRANGFIAIANSVVDGRGGASILGRANSPASIELRLENATLLGDADLRMTPIVNNALVAGSLKLAGESLPDLKGLWTADRSRRGINFQSENPGSAQYVTLSLDNPEGLLVGGADGGEFGVHHAQHNSARVTAAHAAIAEFSPMGSKVELINAEDGSILTHSPWRAHS